MIMDKDKRKKPMKPDYIKIAEYLASSKPKRGLDDSKESLLKFDARMQAWKLICGQLSSCLMYNINVDKPSGYNLEFDSFKFKNVYNSGDGIDYDEIF